VRILVRVFAYIFSCLDDSAFFISHIFSGALYQDHIFLSINPPSGLELCNIAFQNTVDELVERIFSMWPSGVARQVRVKQDWSVRFAGRPWSSKGLESIMYVRGCHLLRVCIDTERSLA
jgi:hypothetical protein